ncbi:winged helix-turn-helix domain-containing protein [Shewanella psychropiezotolerans]|uniref:Winged helix-turn-helix domain-containing protein n=1 Tax=Shewanella psychropiezotolerans TaxID=2593655 RepID=A0ABX5WXR9_9GAMM|nr:winged helix-turn-helix domain-containing protein [Shewanella psychropiezotolerans]
MSINLALIHLAIERNTWSPPQLSPQRVNVNLLWSSIDTMEKFVKDNDVTEVYGLGKRYVFNACTDQLTDTLNDSTIELGINESRLLSLFISHKGDVVSREQILEEVWLKRGLVVDETSVNQTVSLLRKILDDNVREQSYIKTVTKMGYMLTPGVEITENSGMFGKNKSASFYQNPATLKMTFSIFSAICLAILISWVVTEHDPEVKVESFTGLLIDNVELLGFADSEINSDLFPIIKKCIIYISNEYSGKLSKVFISSKDERTLSLLFFYDDSSSFSFRIGLNSNIPLESNQCLIF